jgi:AraC family transcriptional regulator, positive regulator of tynA and feaB
MPQRLDADALVEPQLDDEAWRHTLQQISGARFNPEGIERGTFTGWVRPIDVCGFNAVDAACNAPRVARDARDVRIDGVDHYFVLFRLRGQAVLTQGEQVIRVAAGDALLVDATRPVKFLHEEPCHNFALKLPRQELVTHLGFAPQSGLVRPNKTPAGRLLLQLIQSSNQEPPSEASSANSYMRLAVYDLVGALFASSDPSSGSRHTDELFARVRLVIKQGFVDPDFGPADVAARTGISLRYLQKLFTQRGSTCSEFIYSLRLDHAARLLQRRESLRSDQPLSEIAYACGFLDYTHFARKFRYRFGHPPGAHSANNNGAENATVRSVTDERRRRLVTPNSNRSNFRRHYEPNRRGRWLIGFEAVAGGASVLIPTW